MIDTLEIVIISTEMTEALGIHFEWVGRVVNVVLNSDDRIVDSFSFKEEPTYDQVLTACRSYWF